MCFAFLFDPAAIDQVAKAPQDLERCGLDARSPFDDDAPLVDWSQEQLDQYRRSVAEAGIDVSPEIKNYLSPYLIPLLAETMPPDDVQHLLDKGYATVVRLRLDGGSMLADKEAVQSVKKQLEDLHDARSVIFLEHVKELCIEIEGESCSLRRTVDSDVQLSAYPHIRQRRLKVQNTEKSLIDPSNRYFHVWTRIVGGSGDPKGTELISAAVKHLPNRWPEVRKASVGIAVEDTCSSVEGVFVIFLPTAKTTGTGAYVNAPFYGSLDRRQIDFEEKYNKLILDSVLDLCIETVSELIAGQPEPWRARAVLDIVASVAPVAGEDWNLVSKLCDHARKRGIPLDNQALILCDSGWCPAGKARLMPNVSDDDPLGIDLWRKHARFSVVSLELDHRKISVGKLIESLCGSGKPTDEEWVETIERLAQEVREGQQNINWNAFLGSLLAVLPDNLRNKPRWQKDSLAEARFLPTTDGRLISASESTKLLFRPVQGVDDVAECVEEVPAVLRDRLAFLHADVQTHEGKSGRNTEVQEFLEGRFVKGFSRQDLLQHVVIPALPSLPVSHESSEAVHCAQILAWVFNLIGKESPQPFQRHLRQLLVCCHGGWLPVSSAIFGPGWPVKHGENISTLADALPNEASQRLKMTMLLPPDDKLWLIDNVKDWVEFFTHIGVVDGLRLQEHGVMFSMDEYGSDLPQMPPTDTPKEAWADWYEAVDSEVHSSYVGRHQYRLSGLQLLPELHHLSELNRLGRRALSDLLLSAFDCWDAGWREVIVTKTHGQSWSKSINSPLKHWLRNGAWLCDRDGDAQPLSLRWLVPESFLRGQPERYAHLDPLSSELARRLDRNQALLGHLVMLGLNVYPTEDERTGPSLLNALGTALASGRVPSGRFNVLLGQVREAWHHFGPDKGFPSLFLVRTGRQRSFEARKPNQLNGVYLPDNRNRLVALQDQGKSILEMEVRDARRLADLLVEETGVYKASRLEEQYMVDGSRWNGQAAEAVPLDASEYRWLPLVLLSVTAYGGTNPAGATTNAWRDAVEKLKRTHVLKCGSIVVKLVHDNTVVGQNEPQSQSLPGDVLAVRQDAASYKDLAAAAQAIVGRQDLLKDLRLVLGSLPVGEAVTPDHIEVALESAEIDAPAFADIRQRWDGNMSAIADRVRPVLKLLGVPENGFGAAATDINNLTEWLSANLCGWQTSDLLSEARRSHNDHAMGKAAWRTLGELAQLPAWNAALEALGNGYEAVENASVEEQTRSHLEEVTLLLRGLARHVARKANNVSLFRHIEEVNQGFRGDRAWSKQWWEVPFTAVLNGLTDRYKIIPELMPYIQLIKYSATAESLGRKLEESGIEVDSDPYEIADKNLRSLGQVLSKLGDIYRAWVEFSEASGRDTGLPQPPSEYDGTEYWEIWSDSELLAVAFKLLDDQEFTDACTGCSNLNAVRPRLNLMPQDIETWREERRLQQREAQRQHRTHNVAGEPFEVGEANYRDLFDRINKLDVPNGPRASTDELAVLDSITMRERGGDTTIVAPEEIVLPSRPSGDLIELVGVVGEIWAYHYLRSEFGTEVVTRMCWVSEIRREVLPPLEGEPSSISDGHGYDFKFTHQQKIWYVEVKATAGEDSQFDLGVSEIRAATQFARVQEDCWRILRVRKALEKQPVFDWLPNPFEDEFKDRFWLHRGGMRVSYSRRPNGH